MFELVKMQVALNAIIANRTNELPIFTSEKISMIKRLCERRAYLNTDTKKQYLMVASECFEFLNI